MPLLQAEPPRSSRSGPPPPPRTRPPPSLFPKIPGLSKKLGELLAGRAARVEGARRLVSRYRAH